MGIVSLEWKRVSESSHTLCTDAANTQDGGQSNKTLFPHSFSVLSSLEADPNSSLTSLQLVGHGKPLLAFLRT